MWKVVNIGTRGMACDVSPVQWTFRALARLLRSSWRLREDVLLFDGGKVAKWTGRLTYISKLLLLNLPNGHWNVQLA